MTLAPAPKRRYLTPNQKAAVYEREGGVCYLCSVVVDRGLAEYDHRENRWLSGKQALADFWPVHHACHAIKSAAEAASRAKIKRQAAKHEGTYRPSRRPLKSNGAKIVGRGFEGWRKFDNSLVRRVGR
jgi:hypothetical protein